MGLRRVSIHLRCRREERTLGVPYVAETCVRFETPRRNLPFRPSNTKLGPSFPSGKGKD